MGRYRLYNAPENAAKAENSSRIYERFEIYYFLVQKRMETLTFI